MAARMRQGASPQRGKVSPVKKKKTIPLIIIENLGDLTRNLRAINTYNIFLEIFRDIRLYTVQELERVKTVHTLDVIRVVCEAPTRAGESE